MTDLPSLKLLIPYFLCIGALTAYFAHEKRGRSPLLWFFLGFFFGLLGLLTLFLIPKKPIKEPTDIISIETPKKPNYDNYPMTKQLWYFLDASGKQIGPISFYALKAKYAKGDISKSSYVWNAHLEQWEILSQLTEYFSLIDENPEFS